MGKIKVRYDNNAVRPGHIDEEVDNLAVPRTIELALTAAQMNTLNATPVTVIPAPGAGKFILVHDVVTKIDFASVAFELGTGTLDYKIDSAVVAQVPNATVESGSDVIYRSVGLVGALTANTALTVTTSADVTAGDGSVSAIVYYSILEI